MKEMWKKFRNSKYFKIVLGLVLVVLLGFAIYSLFIEGHLKFQKNEEAFLAGVKKYYEYNPTKRPKEGNYQEIKLSTMFQGSWVESLYVPKKDRLCDGDSFIRVINENGEFRYITYLKCGKYESKVDHQAPTIVLNGEDTVVIHLNETYTDAGVKEVKDNHDKLNSSDVTVDTSKVDTSKIGNYEVTYRVLDKSYNRATIKRTVVVAETLSDHIKNEKGQGFVYQGPAADNYVLFSGMLWRILKLDSEGNIMLITDNTISNVFYGASDKSYPDSNVYKWLNTYFLSNISEKSQNYIIDTKWCYDDRAEAGIADVCNSSVNAKIGLLNLSDYERAKVDNRSYLVNQARFYMLNRQNEQSIWISDLYTDNALLNADTKDLVGVRPVLSLSKDIYLTSGTGTKDDPYKLQDYTYAKENDLLNSRLVGEYVVYSGYIFRIAGVDSDGNTKLIGTSLLQNSSDNRLVVAKYADTIEKLSPNANEEGNLYYDIDKNAINYISEKSLVSHEFEVPVYENNSDYDAYKKEKVTSKIGLPASYEIFSGLNLITSDYQIYWLSDYNESGIVSIINGNNGIAFYLSRDSFPENGVKPVIYVKSNLKVASGKGTVTNPYYVR